MFHLLGFLFIIFLVVLVIGLSIVGSILRAVFGFGRRRSTPKGTHRTYRNVNPTEGDPIYKNTESEEVINEPSGTKHKKIFTKEEGEYVDFEEIKD